MIETFQKILQDVCVSALAAMAVFAALCFVAEMVRRVMANLPSVTLAVFLFVVSASSVIIGGGKTNGLLQAILPFVPQVQQVQLPQAQPVVPPERPYGEWNDLELICAGDTAEYILNGKTVLKIFDLAPSAGRIQLQSECHTIEYRNITIEPIAAK